MNNFGKLNDKKYISSFDGVRSIALLGVLFFHLVPGIAKGGYLGVVTFFVLAGYLSFDGLMTRRESKSSGSTSFFTAIGKKIAKLYPPLLLMLFLVNIIVFLFFKPQFSDLATDVRGAVFSLNNYFQIFSGSSYFEVTGSIAPFKHLWALSLEIQAYFLIFVFFYGRYTKDKKLKWFMTLFIVSILSFVFSVVLLGTGADYSRLYYGLLTRLYSFSIGGMACFFAQNETKKNELLESSTRDLLSWILLGVSVISYFIFDPNGFMFGGGFLLYTVIISVLLAFVRFENSSVGQVLSHPVFSFLTKRSYHIFLWHYPIIVLMDRFFATSTISGLLYYPIFFIACAIFSELSFRVTSVLYSLPFNLKFRLISLAVLSFLLLVIPYKSISENTPEKIALEEMKQKIIENEEAQKDDIKTKVEKEEDSESGTKGPQDSSVDDNKVGEGGEESSGSSNPEDNVEEGRENGFVSDAEKSPYLLKALEYVTWVNSLGDDFLYLNPSDYEKYRDTKALLIGDSLASMSYHTLALYMPEVLFDTEHSRQMGGAYEAYQEYSDVSFGDYVILSLGTNGEVMHDDIEKVRSELNGKKLIILSIVLPYKDEEDSRNASLRSYAEKYDDVYLVDWHKAAKNRPELFFDDMIHTGEDGAKILGQIIIKKIIEIEKQ